MLHGSLLEATGVELTDAGALSWRLVVTFEAADIVVVFHILFSTESAELLCNVLVVSDIDIVHLALKHLLLSVGKEGLNLTLHLIALSHVADTELSCVTHLDAFELDTKGPLLEELGVFIVSVESRGCELETPPGCSTLLDGAPGVPGVRVVDHVLVIVGLAEGPWLLFVESVVDNGHVGIRRVRVEGLTLGVVEEELLISVHGGDDGRGTHGAALLGHEGLQALVVVGAVHLGVVHVVVLVGVVSERLMETGEGSVEGGAIDLAGNDALKTKVKTVVDAEATISSVLILIVDAAGLCRAALVLAHAVLVNAPEVIDAIADGLLVAVLTEKSRSSSEEGNVLDL